MPNPISVGITCQSASERAVLVEWLAAAGYNPVPLPSLRSLPVDLETRPIEALVTDAETVSHTGLAAILRMLTSNRPLIVIGSLRTCPPELRARASWLDRPVSVDALVMGVALALAEGRPARRSPRKSVLQLPATVDGLASSVIDVSDEGVRLELNNIQRGTLPPFFTLRVEAFSVAMMVKRIWVAHPSEQRVLCGGIIQRHLPRSNTWTHLVAIAPSAASSLTSF